MKAHWGDKDLELAAKRGLFAGDPDGNMRPADPMIRAELATVANRLYDSTRESFIDLVGTIEPAVVMVLNESPGGGVDSVGSGVSIGGGLVLTNRHVLQNPDGTTDDWYGIAWSAWSTGYAMANLVHVDAAVDLAILRVGIAKRDEMPVLPLGAPGELRKAEPVAVVGSPVGLIGTITTGIVSYIGRGISYEMPDGSTVRMADMVQTDAPINPGNSGGALVSLRGELVGVPSVKLAHLAYEGLGFAIGVRTIQEVLDRAEIQLAPKPSIYRPNYERYGWHVTRARHTRTKPVRYLVVHHEGGTGEGSSALAIHRYHVRPPADGGRGWAAIGYHACFEQDGRTAEGRPLWAVGAHAKGYNDASLGLCIAGNMDRRQPRAAQLDAAVAWLRWAKLLHPQAEIVGHNELPGMATSCPGDHIDMDDLRTQVEGG